MERPDLVRWRLLLDVERRRSHLRAVLEDAVGGRDERGREICKDVLEWHAEVLEGGDNVFGSAASTTANLEYAELVLAVGITMAFSRNLPMRRSCQSRRAASSRRGRPGFFRSPCYPRPFGGHASEAGASDLRP